MWLKIRTFLSFEILGAPAIYIHIYIAFCILSLLERSSSVKHVSRLSSFKVSPGTQP